MSNIVIFPSGASLSDEVTPTSPVQESDQSSSKPVDKLGLTGVYQFDTAFCGHSIAHRTRM